MPGGHFECWNELLLGELEVNLLDNPIGYDMAYYDVASVLKLLHARFVEDRSRSFEFEFRAQVDGRGEWTPVMEGEWRQDPRPPDNSQVGSQQSGGVNITK